jgi:hypothetical protein
MSDAEFLSGQWFGFYTCHGCAKRFLMDLVLEFRSGKMTGEGADGVGAFVISGSYSTGNGECSWIKQYVGRHAVDDKGYHERKGIGGSLDCVAWKGWFQDLALG